jgi:hypothetical protein
VGRLNTVGVLLDAHARFPGCSQFIASIIGGRMPRHKARASRGELRRRTPGRANGARATWLRYFR